jgi:BCCT family betaine/carnitine transporter
MRARNIFGIPTTDTVQVILITAITAVALISVLRGLDGGVKVLSEINMVLACCCCSSCCSSGRRWPSSPGSSPALVAYFAGGLPALSMPVRARG